MKSPSFSQLPTFWLGNSSSELLPNREDMETRGTHSSKSLLPNHWMNSGNFLHSYWSNGHWNSWFAHETWWFSIVMWVFPWKNCVFSRVMFVYPWSSFSTQHAQRWVLAHTFVTQWVFRIVIYVKCIYLDPKKTSTQILNLKGLVTSETEVRNALGFIILHTSWCI